MRIIIANWKMYHDTRTALTLARELLDLYGTTPLTHSKLIVCPPATTLVLLREYALKKKVTSIAWGAQYCSPYSEGAHTGEISARMLSQAGAQYCLIGHQERITEHHETVSSMRSMLTCCIESGMTPILCVGESRENMSRLDAEREIKLILDPLITHENLSKLSTILIAYEPRWAIGREQPAPIMHINDSCQFILHTYPQAPITLLYGGSIQPHTVTALLTNSPVQGFLLGRAGADRQNLSKIVSLCDNFTLK